MSVYQKLPRPFYVLAPMDDVTDTVFRQIINNLAPPDLYFTEFVNVDGLVSSGKDKLLSKLAYNSTEKPIVAQLWGKEPVNFKKIATDIKNMGFDGIDLNMGCPDKAIVKNGCCSGLINNRDLARKIILATIEGAKGLPVSIKTRIGFNEVDISWPEFLLDFEISALTIHGRTRKQMSKSPVDWNTIDHIRQIRDQKKVDVLIIGNGDIDSREQGDLLAQKYQLDGLMIGRGALKDPFVFSKNSPWLSYPVNQKIELFIKHIELFKLTYIHNERSFKQLFKFAKLYINGFDGANELRTQIMSIHTPDEALKILKKII